MRLNKINKLSNGNQIFAYWANNRGRGSNNCTLQIVPAGVTRPRYSRMTKNVFAETTTSSWRGSVNLSKLLCEKLGITKEQIII